ncbi:MAG TPA: hypothetical protein VMS01_01110 [Stellaceae bacterium]|nr:hypothetical protein [Stellaceae bacterium]
MLAGLGQQPAAAWALRRLLLGRRRILPRLATRRRALRCRRLSGICSPRGGARERAANAPDQVREGRRCDRQADSALRLDAVLQPPGDCVEVERELLVDGGLDRGQNNRDPIEFGLSDRDLGGVVGGRVAFVQQLIGRLFQFVSDVSQWLWHNFLPVRSC